jgi:thiamine biosynthesis protein ThiS
MRLKFHYNEPQKRVSNSAPPAKITVSVNGERREAPAGLHLRALLEWLEIDASRVAVELNRRIVRKTDWESAAVEPGASLEIVEFVGGG